MSLEDKQCAFIRDGKLCRGFHQSNSEFCFTHDPLKAQARADAVRKGGLAPKRKLPLPPVIAVPPKILSRPLNRLRGNEDVERAIKQISQACVEGKLTEFKAAVLLKSLRGLLPSHRW